MGKGNVRKTCFVISPIGQPNSDIRRHIDGVIEQAIEPVLKELDYSVEVSHKIDETGSVSKQIIERILNAELVVANLTSLNPNVMYELAIRHCACRPVITIAEHGTPLPFDVSDERTIFYINDMNGVGGLKRELAGQLEHLSSDPSPDNPVYRVSQSAVLKHPDGTGLKEAQFLYQYLQRLEGSLGRLDRSVQSLMLRQYTPPVQSGQTLGLGGLLGSVGSSGLNTTDFATVGTALKSASLEIGKALKSK